MKIVSILLLIACTPHGQFVYRTPFGVFDSIVELNEIGLNNKLTLASLIYDSKFGPGEFNKIGHANRLHIRSECHWQAVPLDNKREDEAYGGETVPWLVLLSPSISAIVHEFIHAREEASVTLGTPWHDGWDKPKLRKDGSNSSNWDIDWAFRNAISPFPESHEVGFDMAELDKYGYDGRWCWFAK